LADNLDALVIEVDREERILFLNQPCAARLSRSPRQFVGAPLTQVLPQITPLVLERVRQALRDGRPDVLEYQSNQLPGSRWQRVKLVPLHDAAGKFTSLLAIATDIDDARNTEEALRRSEQRCKVIYDNNPIPCYIWQWNGQDFVLVNYNQAGFKAAKGMIEEWLGLPAKLFHRDQPAIIHGIYSCFAEQQTKEWEGSFFSKTYAEERHFHAFFIPFPPDAVLVQPEDVTERKRMVARLQESERFHRALIETANDSIAVLQGEKLVFCNPQLAMILGRSVKELTGSKFLDHVAQDQRELVGQFYARRAKGERELGVIPISLVAKGGHEIQVEINGARIEFQGAEAELLIVRELNIPWHRRG